MARVVHQQTVDPAGLAELLRPRDDVVLERPLGGGVFEAEHGPVRDYRRTVVVDDAGTTATETIDFRIAMPVWGLVVLLPFKRELRRGSGRRAAGKQPWWAPPDRLDRRAAGVLGVLLTASLVTGYLGTLITQTITFAAEEFGADDQAQGVALAGVRVGVLIALVVMSAADRVGRRRVLVATATLGCVLAATGALAPSLFWLTTSQTMARSMSISLSLLIAIFAAEEMPRNSRAYAFSVIAMTAGLGGGICLWVLPVADLGERAWRVVYLVPLLGLVLVRAVHRSLPESKRYARPHAEVRLHGHGGRLVLLAVSAFLLELYAAPASQFQNEFLRDERDFSAAGVSVFTMLTATPAGLCVALGGRLADTRGRRLIGAVGIAGGAAFTAISFLSDGAALWLWALAGTMISGFVVPVVGVYRPEMFPTSLRGRANGIISVVGMTGAAIGLLVVGSLSDGPGDLGPSIAAMAVAPILVAVLLLTAYPETAHLELEQINPEDAAAPSPPTPRPAPSPAPPRTGRRPRR